MIDKQSIPKLPEPFSLTSVSTNGLRVLLIGESKEMIGLFWWDGYSVSWNNEEIFRRNV